MTNKPDLKLIQGGVEEPLINFGGKEPPTENWLLEMPEWTCFAAREQNSRNPAVQEFEVLRKFERVVKLKQFHPTGEDIEIAVDSLVFSRYMTLVEKY
jgi:hypothetical protein